MAEQNAAGTNPALSELDFLVGEWRTELSNAAFLPDRSATIGGHTSSGWVEDGAFLAMRQYRTASSPPQAVLVIGRDQVEGNYEVLYFDRRPMSRIYHMNPMAASGGCGERLADSGSGSKAGFQPTNAP